MFRHSVYCSERITSIEKEIIFNGQFRWLRIILHITAGWQIFHFCFRHSDIFTMKEDRGSNCSGYRLLRILLIKLCLIIPLNRKKSICRWHTDLKIPSLTTFLSGRPSDAQFTFYKLAISDLGKFYPYYRIFRLFSCFNFSVCLFSSESFWKKNRNC